MAHGKMIDGKIALVASFVLATPVAAQNTVTLAPGETLLQLQETASVIEPVGSITTICTLSAPGDDKAAALSELAKSRPTLNRTLLAAGVQSGAVENVGEPSAERDYSEAAIAAAEDAADAAVAAAAAAGGSVSAATEDDNDRYRPKIKYAAKQIMSVRFTRYAQLEATQQISGFECMAGASPYTRSSSLPVVEAQDPQGAALRAQQKTIAMARTRADSYAAAMGMKVIRIQRVSEVGEITSLIGPQISRDFVKMMALGGGIPTEPLLRQDKVKIERGLFIDFVLGPK